MPPPSRRRSGTSSTRTSTKLDHTALSLSHADFDQWRNLIIKAPSATQLKFEAGVFLSHIHTPNHNQNHPPSPSSPSTPSPPNPNPPPHITNILLQTRPPRPPPLPLQLLRTPQVRAKNHPNVLQRTPRNSRSAVVVPARSPNPPIHSQRHRCTGNCAARS